MTLRLSNSRVIESTDELQLRKEKTHAGRLADIREFQRGSYASLPGDFSRSFVGSSQSKSGQVCCASSCVCLDVWIRATAGAQVSRACSPECLQSFDFYVSRPESCTLAASCRRATSCGDADDATLSSAERGVQWRYVQRNQGNRVDLGR